MNTAPLRNPAPSCARAKWSRFNHRPCSRARMPHSCSRRNCPVLNHNLGCRVCQHQQAPRNQTDTKPSRQKKHAFPGKQRFNLMLLSFGNWQLATGYGLEATGDWGLATGNCPPATCTLYPVPSLYPCTETPANDSTATPLTGSPNHCAGSNLLESSSVSRSARVSESLGPDTMS